MKNAQWKVSEPVQRKRLVWSNEIPAGITIALNNGTIIVGTQKN